MTTDDRRPHADASTPRSAAVSPLASDTRVPRQLVEELVHAWNRDARMLGDRPSAGVLLAHAGEAAEFGAHDPRRARDLYERSAAHPDCDARAFAGIRRIARDAGDAGEAARAWGAEVAAAGERADQAVIASVAYALARVRRGDAPEDALASLRSTRALVARAAPEVALLWRGVVADVMVMAGRVADALKLRQQRWNESRADDGVEPTALAHDALVVAMLAARAADDALAARWEQVALEQGGGPAAVDRLVRRAHDAGDLATVEALLADATPDEDDPDRRGDLLYTLGHARAALGDRSGALGALAEAARCGVSAPAAAHTFLGLARASHGSVVAGEFVDALGATLDFAAAGAERADVLVQMAQRFDAELGMTDTALDLAREALSELPAFRPAIRLLGTIFRREAMWPDLAELGEHELGLESDPAESIRLHERLADIYLEDLSDPAKAEAHLRAALALAPHLPAVRRLARLLAEQHRFADLVAHLEASVPRVPSPRERAYMLEQAAEVCEARLRDFERAIRHYRALMELREATGGATSSLARLLSQTGRWKELLELNERELAGAPRDVTSRVALFCRSAEIARRHLGDVSLAEEYFRRALEEDPACDEALRGLGGLLSAQQRWDDLVHVTEREMAASRSVAHRARCLRQLGSLHAVRLRAPADAARCFEELARIDASAEDEALVWLERLAHATDDPAAVLQVLERRLARAESEADPASRARIAFRIAETLEWRLREPARAFGFYVDALGEALPAGVLALGALDRLWRAEGVDEAARAAAVEGADLLAEHEERRIRVAALRLVASRAEGERARDAWRALHGEDTTDPVAAAVCALNALQAGDLAAAESAFAGAPAGVGAVARAHLAALDGGASPAETEVEELVLRGVLARERGERSGFDGAHERDLFARIGEGRVTLADLRDAGESETGLRLAALAAAAIGEHAVARERWSALADGVSDPMRSTRLRVDYATQAWVPTEERWRWLRDAAALHCWDPPLRDELHAEFRAAGDLEGLDVALAEALSLSDADSERASDLARQRATCLELLGRRDEAIDALRFCAVHTPGDAEVALEKARLETLVDRIDDARATLEDSLAEGVSGAARLQVLGRLADLHQMHGGSRERAVEVLEEAWQVSEGAREWGIRLASAHATFGDAARCVALLQELLPRLPAEADIRHWQLLSRVYATRLDRRDDAEEVLWVVFLAHPGRRAALAGLEDFYRRYSGAATFADRLADALAARHVEVDATTAAELWTYVGELNLTVLRRFAESERAYAEARRVGGDTPGLLLREARAVAGQSGRARQAARLVVSGVEIAAPDVAFWDDAAHDLEGLFRKLGDTSRMRVAEQLRRALGAPIEASGEWLKRDPTRSLDAASAWSLLGRGLLDDAERAVLGAAAPLAEKVLARIGSRHPVTRARKLRAGEARTLEGFAQASAAWLGIGPLRLADDGTGTFHDGGVVGVPLDRVGADHPVRARFWAGYAAGLAFSGMGAWSWTDDFGARELLRAVASRMLGASTPVSEQMGAEVASLLLTGARRAAAGALRDHPEVADAAGTGWASTAVRLADRAGLVFCGDLAVAIEEILVAGGWQGDLAEPRTREQVLTDTRTSTLIRWALSDAHFLARYESGIAPRPSLFD